MKHFEDNSNPYLKKMDVHLTREYLKKMKLASVDTHAPLAVLNFLRDELKHNYQANFELINQHSAFLLSYSKEGVQIRRVEMLLNYAQKLGATSDQLKKDKKAIERWFDLEAMIERYESVVSELEFRTVFLLRKIGSLLNHYFRDNTDNPKKMWHEYNLEELINLLLVHEGDVRVRVEAIKTLVEIIKPLSKEAMSEFVKDNIVQFIYRSALDHLQNTWIQCEALNFLNISTIESFFKVAEIRLGEPKNHNDIFVRRHIVDLLKNHGFDEKEVQSLIPKIMKDKSPYVRQSLAELFKDQNNPSASKWLRELIFNDKNHTVRAAAVLNLKELGLLIECIEKEKHPFVLRTAFHTAEMLVEKLFNEGGDNKNQSFANLLKAIQQHHSRHNDLAVRRWAQLTSEKLWVLSNTEARTLKERLAKTIPQIKVGKSFSLSKQQYSDLTLARVLSVFAQTDYGFQVQKGWTSYKIFRGNRFRFRAWRFIFELENPFPSKRLGHPHTIGREYMGNYHIPSTILSELSETRVPGEPLYIASEAGWRPYLPLVEEILTARNIIGKKTRIVSSEGITEIKPPSSVIKHIMSGIKLNFNFQYYARLRNWREDDNFLPNAFIDEIRKLGFKIEFLPHTYDESISATSDPHLLRFFHGNVPSTAATI